MLFLAFGSTDLNFRTELLIAMVFSLAAIAGRLIMGGGKIFSTTPMPFLRNPANIGLVAIGIVVVLVAQIVTLHATPIYSTILTILPGSIFGFIPYSKIFYMVEGGFEEIFFRLGLQAYFEQEFRNPHYSILVSSGVFAAYHQFVFQYFSLVIFASSIVLGYMMYFTDNPNVNILMHMGINFIAG